MKNIIVSTSILSADLLNLKGEIDSIIKAKTDWIHLDIMDGSFVPPITFGDNIVKALRPYAKKFLDVHLMIQNPQNQLKFFKDAGANLITIHYESFKNKKEIKDTLLKIKKLGLKTGLSIKPKTDPKKIFSLLAFCDVVLIMSVEPGFGGQKFIPSALKKITTLKNEIEKQDLTTLLEIDGGIDDKTCKKCKENGIDILVAGTYIFKSKDKAKAISKLKSF